MHRSRNDLRKTFNTEAELYNKARPLYPEALFDTLVRITYLPADARLLEIGPGTGQATKALARRGYHITGVELGEALATVARRELRDFPHAEIITGAFEDVDLPPKTFDLVFAATAFHWIKPEVRFTKPHRLLKPGSHLAIIHTNHVSDEQGDAFFHSSHPIYEKYFPSKQEQKLTLPRATDIKPAEVDDGLFKLIHFECFPLIMHYTIQEFLELISTYSPTLALPADTRKAFLHDIAACIDKEFKGSLVRHFAMSLTVAKNYTSSRLAGGTGRTHRRPDTDRNAA